MKFEEFLVALKLDQRLNLADAVKAGACSIEFDNRVTINIEYDKAQAVAQVYCIAGRAPTVQRDAFFAMLLQAHMFGTATDGCMFGFAPQNEEIILFKTIALGELDTATAIKQLESVVNQSIRWTAYLPELLDDWEKKIAHAALSMAPTMMNARN
ncbi:type III secretion system chaperone [Bordetella sp. 15P40C-2]|uniref:type III secretion system chaperone n=1 Tax=Bordetella sp. 15P40C-2 TaxID=2572246 RepID=UPI0013240309|nr:type III secretion system chaperone [Bordetella sp. 15P40C-2]MVW70498.1 hypothetical protein [Bordetella sp. 15P40C-2]